MDCWDWYAFWTGGPIRRAVFESMKQYIRFMESFWDMVGRE